MAIIRPMTNQKVMSALRLRCSYRSHVDKDFFLAAI